MWGDGFNTHQTGLIIWVIRQERGQITSCIYFFQTTQNNKTRQVLACRVLPYIPTQCQENRPHDKDKSIQKASFSKIEQGAFHILHKQRIHVFLPLLMIDWFLFAVMLPFPGAPRSATLNRLSPVTPVIISLSPVDIFVFRGYTKDSRTLYGRGIANWGIIADKCATFLTESVRFQTIQSIWTKPSGVFLEGFAIFVSDHFFGASYIWGDNNAERQPDRQ